MSDDYDDHSYCFTCNKHEVTCWCADFFSPDREDEDERDAWCWTPDAHEVQPVTWPATRRTLSDALHYDSEAGWSVATVTQWIGAHGGHVASWVTTDPDVQVWVRPMPDGVELATDEGRTVAAQWGPSVATLADTRDVPDAPQA